MTQQEYNQLKEENRDLKDRLATLREELEVVQEQQRHELLVLEQQISDFNQAEHQIKTNFEQKIQTRLQQMQDYFERQILKLYEI